MLYTRKLLEIIVIKIRLPVPYKSLDPIDTCLCLFPQGNTFLLNSRLDSAVKRCSSEVLKLSFQWSCSVKGLAQETIEVLIRSEVVGVAKVANN